LNNELAQNLSFEFIQAINVGFFIFINFNKHGHINDHYGIIGIAAGFGIAKSRKKQYFKLN
jgi:hypothetical protein